jgi:hypothetical protein
LGLRRRLQSGALYNLYASQNSTKAIRSGRIRWAGYVARMRNVRSAWKVLVVKHEGRRPLGGHMEIILKWILGK